MKELLVVSYYYHQKTSVASNRTRGIIKYLPEYGWNVTLLTLNKNHCDYMSSRIGHIGNSCTAELIEFADSLSKKNENIMAPVSLKNATLFGFFVKNGVHLFSKISKYNISSKLFSLLKCLIYPISSEKRWMKSALLLGKHELTRKRYDALLSTYGPAEVHLVCSEFSGIFDIPWIADYRDHWSLNEYDVYHFGTTTEKEIQTLIPSIHLTAVSKPIAEDLSQLHKKNVSVIPNGFDPVQVNPIVPLRDKFTITHTGQLYHGKRDPSLLFRAIDELLRAGNILREEISIEFYGPSSPAVSSQIMEWKMEDIVRMIPTVPKEVSLSLQYSSQILLLLTWNNPADVGTYTGKVFEYLAAKRPILSLGYLGDCVLSDLMKETQAGVHPFTYNEVKEQILSWYTEWKENGCVEYLGVDEKINQYSHRGMARKFADVLNQYA